MLGKAQASAVHFNAIKVEANCQGGCVAVRRKRHICGQACNGITPHLRLLLRIERGSVIAGAVWLQRTVW